MPRSQTPDSVLVKSDASRGKRCAWPMPPAETWCTAAGVIATLDGFVVDIDAPSPLLNRWLTAMFVLFRPQIERLLIERDHIIDQWRSSNPDRDVFEDRRLEITSTVDISLHQHIEWLDRQLEPQPNFPPSRR
jgi:hypothetical protein